MNSNKDPLELSVLNKEHNLYPVNMPQQQAELSVSPALPQLTPNEMEALDSQELELCAYIRQQHRVQIQRLQELVNQNSGSRNQQGILAVLDYLTSLYEPMGFVAEHHKEETIAGAPGIFGPHRLLRLNPNAPGPRILLMGHADTVFDPGSGFDTAEIQGDRMRGPGCADMKGGNLVLLGALEGLAQLGLLHRANITILHNGDEEISSRGSRPLILEQAKRAQLGLVFEPGREKPWGAVTLARKGTGSFVLTVRGRAAHSGNRYIDGVSAVDDLARKVVALARLTDLTRGRTINIGILRTPPSAKRNRVADEVTAEFDMRVSDPQDAEKVVQLVREIAGVDLVHNPWTKQSSHSELSGGLAREPMPCDDSRAKLYRDLAGLAKQLEVPIGAVSVGGGSDANIAAANGLLVLDGLGPVGGGLHTTDEWTDLQSLTDRTCLTAVLLHRTLSTKINLS